MHSGQPGWTGAHAPAIRRMIETAPPFRPEATCDALVAEFAHGEHRMAAFLELYQRGAAALAFTPDTPADGGSLAKTFTAAAVWWLAHEGRIDPDAPVIRYLPEFPHPRTSVRHLLSHSNGLPPYYEFFDPHFAPDEVRTTQKMLEVVAREVPVPAFEPGSRSSTPTSASTWPRW